jgi:hypothetical protein
VVVGKEGGVKDFMVFTTSHKKLLANPKPK